MPQQMPTNPIRRLRARLGVTQQELAAGIGCTPGNVGHYEHRQSMPPNSARRLIDFAAERGHVVTFNDIYDTAPTPTPTPTPTPAPAPVAQAPTAAAPAPRANAGIPEGVSSKLAPPASARTMMSSEEVANYLDCEVKTVEEAARAGRLPGVKYGRSWIFPLSALLESLHNEAMETAKKNRTPLPVAIVKPTGRKSRRTPVPTLVDFG